MGTPVAAVPHSSGRRRRTRYPRTKYHLNTGVDLGGALVAFQPAEKPTRRCRAGRGFLVRFLCRGERRRQGVDDGRWTVPTPALTLATPAPAPDRSRR